MKWRILCAVLFGLLLCGAGNTRGILEYGLAKNQDPAGTALLTPAVKLKEDASESGMGTTPSYTGPRLAITSIKSIDQRRYVRTRGYSSVRVLPGSYNLGLACLGGSYQEGLSEEITVEAGKEYYLACTGKTKTTAKLVIVVGKLSRPNQH